MRCLYLDDVRLPPSGGDWTICWTVCRTVEQAKAFVLAGPVEWMSLDHDFDVCPTCHAGQAVGDAQTDPIVPPCSCGAPNGLDFVAWLVETGRWPRLKPHVHSSNRDGAAAMRRLIDEHWREP